MPEIKFFILTSLMIQFETLGSSTLLYSCLYCPSLDLQDSLLFETETSPVRQTILPFYLIPGNQYSTSCLWIYLTQVPHTSEILLFVLLLLTDSAHLGFVSTVCSFLKSLCIYTTFYLLVHPVIGTWAPSIFLLLNDSTVNVDVHIVSRVDFGFFYIIT